MLKAVTTTAMGVAALAAATTFTVDTAHAGPKVHSVSLSVAVGAKKVCPRKSTLYARFKTDGAGTVKFILRRNDGKTIVKTAKAKKQANGKYMAIFKRVYTHTKSVERKYRVKVAGSPVASQWAAMKIKCKKPTPLKVKKVMYGIKTANNNLCPQQALAKGWVYTNKAGSVKVRFRKHDGTVTPYTTINTVKGPAGHVAEYSKMMLVGTSFDAKYRMEVKGSSKRSNWVRFKVTCN